MTFTDGADSDSIAVDEMAFIKITRDADGTTSTDNLVGDCEIWEILIYET